MIAAFLSLAAVLAAPQQQNGPEVEGLAVGESVRLLAPAPSLGAAAPVADAWMFCRLIDASTALPVAGARIEIWTEEITVPTQGFRRIGEARSGRDGRFSIRRRDGNFDGGKVRIIAAGYLAFSGSTSDLFGTLRLFPDDAETAPLRLRFVDVEGRPIAGARVTSTYSCAHDLPAFELQSDARGEVALLGFDVQDHTPQLRVRAAGYRALKYVEAEGALLRHPRDKALDITLHAARPFAVRMLKEDGSPMAHRSLVVKEGDGYHVVRTGADGVARVAARYASEEATIDTLDSDGSHFVGEVMPMDGKVTTLRAGAEDGWPADTRTGLLSFPAELFGSDPTQLGIQLQHDEGWVAYPRDERVEFPIGGATVHSKTRPPFRVTLRAEGLTTAIAPPLESDPSPEPVNPPSTLTLLRDQADIDPDTAERETLIFVSSDGGDAFSHEEVGVARDNQIPVIDRTDGGVECRGGAGDQYLATATRERHASISVRGRFGDPQNTVRVTVPALSSLNIVAPFEWKILGGEEFDLASLTPGPLDLVLQRDDGQRYGLSLNIEPGTERQLRFVR